MVMSPPPPPPHFYSFFRSLEMSTALVFLVIEQLLMELLRECVGLGSILVAANASCHCGFSTLVVGLLRKYSFDPDSCDLVSSPATCKDPFLIPGYWK